MKIYCKFDELIDPKKLKNNPRNRNKHGQDQIDRLAELYKYHGIRHPIIVSNLSKSIVAGHGRKMAAIRAGLKEMPVVYQDFKDAESEYAFVQADNAIALWAELDVIGIKNDALEFPDLDIKMLGIRDFNKDDVIEKGLTDPDSIPEVVDPIAKLGQIYQLGEHRLMCSDSTSEACLDELMQGELADFGFCDPPYNLGFRYNSYDDNKTTDEYLGFTKKWFENLKRYTSRRAITMGTKNIEVMAILEKVAGVGCWVKKNWITSCHIANLQQWEPIFFYGDFTKLKRTTDLYEINRVEQKDVGDHSCPKQVALINEILGNYCDKSVIDLFGGSGTTMISAEINGKKSFLMELDPHYCDIIIARWEAFTGKTAVLLEQRASNEKV